MFKYKFLLLGQRFIERGAWILAPFSWVWGIVAECKNWLYDHRLLPMAKVNRPVVSVGNLVAGGTGKTPLVHLLASQFSHRNVAILSRGYGTFADEAMLLQRRLPKVKVYVGKNRVKLARQAVRDEAQLILLDDGFQYRKLHRDLDLVLLSGADPFGKGHFLPWGFLRDSPRRLKRADALFVSGVAGVPLPPHIGLKVQAGKLLTFQEHPVLGFEGQKAALFSGIARPAAFKKTIDSLGIKVVDEWILADHEPAPIGALCAFAKNSKSLGAKALICTEKDFIKLSPDLRCSLPLYFLEISFQVAEGASEWEKLIAKIDQKIDNITAYDR